MRLKILRNLGAGWPPWYEGQEVDAEPEVGEKLVGQGLAEAVPEKPAERITTVGDAELKAVPPKLPEPKRSPGRPAKHGFEGT